MAEAAVCLRSQIIDDDAGGVNGGRRAWGLSNDNGGVGGGRGIDDVYEVSETTAETTGYRRRAQGIYDNNGGIGGGR